MDRTWNILLVDDDPDFLIAARRVFGHSPRLNAHVETTLEAGEVLRIVDERLFDVVVADYRMQPKDGAELLREVHEVNPGLKRVLLTAFDEEELEARGVAAKEIDLVLDKNDSLTILDKKLTEFLQNERR